MALSVNDEREALESFLSGKLSQVDVRAIQSELNRLWQEAATVDGSDQRQVTRACTCNLILVTSADEADSLDSGLLDGVVLRHPARAVLVLWHPEKARKLEAWVSARCHMVPGALTKQICSEQITVLAEGATDAELLSVINSLSLGDLPLFLWWRLDTVAGDWIGSFLSRCSRVIVDSARAPYSFRFLRNLNSIVESTAGALTVSDLNWRKLLGIRRAIAEEFERLPLSLADLGRIESLTISSAGQEFQNDDCSVQALLLCGWLASRLGWTPGSLSRDPKGRSKATFNSKASKVDVAFLSLPFSEAEPGAVFDIEIVVAGGRSIRVSRDPSRQPASLLVTVKAGDAVAREIVADDVPCAEDALVSQELEDYHDARVFADALELAFELVQTVTV